MMDEKLDRIIVLLEEIAAAFREPEPVDPTTHTCKCATLSGAPVANCPVCQGSGQA